MKTPTYQIALPEYTVKKKSDWDLIGGKIDKIIVKNFLDREVVVRAIGSQEHRGKTPEDLIKIIKKLGTDRYDNNRKGDRYENIEGKPIDIFALDFTVKKKSVILKNFIEPFYTWPPKFGKRPVRLDIIMIYDSSKLKKIRHSYKGREGEVKEDGFVFKNQENKKEALIGVIKIK